MPLAPTFVPLVVATLLGNAMQWDDLKVALAVAEQGTVAGAARDLGVTSSTVNRRLVVLEESLGVRLFDRVRAGLLPTDAGARLLVHAEAMRHEAAELELSVLAGDQRLRGPVVLTCSPWFLPLIADTLATFVRDHPSVELVVRTGDQLADIGEREADVALRLTAKPPEILVGRRICSAAFAVYGHRDYLAAGPVPRRLVAEDDGVPMPDWSSGGDIATRANHLDWTLAAVRRGLGLGRLPCVLADGLPEIERVGDCLEPSLLSVWVLTHERLRRVARVRALTRALAGSLTAMVDRFEGQQVISAS